MQRSRRAPHGRRLGSVLLALLAFGCGDNSPHGPGPAASVRLELRASGLTSGGSAEYRVFVWDTVPIAHGRVAENEADTVRVSSSDAMLVRWLDETVRIGETKYVFGPAERQVALSGSDTDTAIAVLARYALASGGFVLSVPGLPTNASAAWRVWGEDDSLLARGLLRPGEIVRRGDLPPGHLRVLLDSAYVEILGARYAYLPPEPQTAVTVTASFDLVAIDAPYTLATVVVRFQASGLPVTTYAPWGLTLLSGQYSIGGAVLPDSTQLVDLVAPGSYTLEWGEVTVDGITYVPDPATRPVTLEARIEPYDFAVAYTALP